MGKIFDLDSPIMRALTKLADIMWLNVMVLVFFIPLIIEQFFFLSPFIAGQAELEIGYVLYAWLFGIVCSIPVGPALTGMHYVLLKMVRDEDSYVTKSFFKSFKQNFKQGMILQILQFGFFGVLLLDFMLMRNAAGVYRYIIMGVALLAYIGSLYIYPLLAKFDNTVLGTVKNAFLMAILALPRSIAMVLVSTIPVLVLYFFDIKALPLIILMGISGPGILCAYLYSETFKRFEPKEESLTEEEELDRAIKRLDDDPQ